jgi:hypothetical protein
MTYAGPAIGRGIDLQAELIRRACRTPVATATATTGAVQHNAHRRRAVGAPQEGLRL